jgi:hypothetical protein
MNENQTPKANRRLMRLAAERASARPEFLGYLFNIYRKSRNISLEDLAIHLTSNEKVLDHLALCRPPVSGTEVGPAYKEYIQTISQGLEVDQKKLSSVIRNAMNLQRLQETQQSQQLVAAPRLALAARDRLEEIDVPGSNSDQDSAAKQPGESSIQGEDETK